MKGMNKVIWLIWVSMLVSALAGFLLGITAHTCCVDSGHCTDCYWSGTTTPIGDGRCEGNLDMTRIIVHLCVRGPQNAQMSSARIAARWMNTCAMLTGTVITILVAVARRFRCIIANDMGFFAGSLRPKRYLVSFPYWAPFALPLDSPRDNP
jgi:hypothetical protein